MPNIELLIFDFDGTLVDSKYDIAKSVNLTLEELGLPLRESEEIFSFVGNGIKQLLRCSVGQDNDTGYEEALRSFRRHYLSHCIDTTRLYPGITQIFNQFKGRPKAIATNKSKEYTLKIVEGLGIQDEFVVIEGPANITDLKPAPSMLLRILEILSTPKDRTVLIGDSTNDVQAAQAAGIRSCAVGYGYGNREKILKLEPDYFCETPYEIPTKLSV